MYPPKKILVPFDFSKYSQAALAQTIELARQTPAEIHLLHVMDVDDPDVRREVLCQLERQVNAEVMLQRKVAHATLSGTPAREIVRVAGEGFDLIVMGTHGRSGLLRLAMGSVAEEVLRSAPCPVLVVRHPDQLVAGGPDAATAEPSDHDPALELVRRAAAQRATDIHIDPVERDSYRVRFRIDGQLQRYCELDRDVADRLIHQLKILGNLDIADPFRPKEGRLRLPESMVDLEARVTTSPVAGGTALAVRLFARDAEFRRLDQLGFSASSLAAIHDMLHRGEGVVLVTGPTGSGKTTTVYSMLDTVRHGELNIVSIEDPVEFPVPFVRQMEVDTRHGVTMTSGLRTLLRMDPDVVFLGEIRDGEALDIAMRAASSGKYVFTTLHTRDAAGTITALRDLHGDCRSLAANLTGVVSQRLVRRLCPHCREVQPVSAERRTLLEGNTVSLPEIAYAPRGCAKCRGTGYHGRIGIFEAVSITDPIRDTIVKEFSEAELRERMRSCAVVSLTDDAVAKVREGLTSVEEVLQMRWL